MHPYFVARSIPEPNSGCYLWEGALRNGNGYGAACVANVKGAAHRLSYALHCGPIPDGMEVCHKCDVRSCVNPDHLFLGTHRDNMADMQAKGRKPAVVGVKNPAAKLTEDQVVDIFNAPGFHGVIAEQYGVDRSLVSGIKRGAFWPHLKLRRAA